MIILSVGDLLLDLHVRYDPLSGEADTGPEGVQIWPGGSAANFAVQAARLGAEMRFVGRVGRDWAGDMLVRSLEAEGVITSIKAIDEEPSGRVFVMVDPKGNRRMWSYPGASSTIRPADLNPAWFDNLDAFHLTGYSLLREGPRAASLTALGMARERASPLCTLDPNPGHLIADYGAMRFREMLAELRFDIIFPSLEEGRLLMGEKGTGATPEAIAADLLEISPIVALTLGADGCLVAIEAETFRVEAQHIDSAIDATGAGDSFAAAFVVAYIARNHDLRAAAETGNCLAAEVVSRPGGR